MPDIDPAPDIVSTHKGSLEGLTAPFYIFLEPTLMPAGWGDGINWSSDASRFLYLSYHDLI